MQTKLGTVLNLKQLFLPKDNQWLRRTALVFAFILFDYVLTLTFCRVPHEEVNTFARIFMESFGIPVGLTMFVVLANLPIYMTLSLDSHIVRLPAKMAVVAGTSVDVLFAWFIAGLHFSGGASWFWCAPDLVRQALGSIIYLVTIFLIVRPYRQRHNNL